MFKCAGCIAKDKQIEYLQRLVDQTLIKNGMMPILPPQGGDKPLEDMEGIEVASEIGADDIKQYGGDS